MAADFFAEVTDEAISEIMDAVDPDIREILCQVGRVKQDVLVKELIASSDVKRLLNVRCTMFRAAMDRVDLCLSQVAKAIYDDECNLSSEQEKMIDKAETMLKSLVPKDMIQRKCIKRLSNDILDLLYFAGGSDVGFPISVLKATAANGSPINPHDVATSRAIACLQHVASSIQDTHSEGCDDWESENGRGEWNCESSCVTSGAIDLEALIEENPYGALRDEGCMSTSVESSSSEAGESRESDENGDDVDGQEQENGYDNGAMANMGEGKCEENVSIVAVRDGAAHESVSMESRQGIQTDIIENSSGEILVRESTQYNKGFVSVLKGGGEHESINEIAPNLADGGAVGAGQGPNDGNGGDSHNKGVGKGQSSVSECPRDLGGEDTRPLIGGKGNASRCHAGAGRSDNHTAASTSIRGGADEHISRGNLRESIGHSEESRTIAPDKLATQWVPIKVTISVGNITAEIDLPEGPAMAARNSRGSEGGKGSGGSLSCGCKFCEDRMDAQDRRIDSLEELLVEKAMKLSVENEGLRDEFREVRVKLADMQDGEPTTNPNIEHLQIESERPPPGTLYERVDAEGALNGGRNARQEKRERAASYAGITREGLRRRGRNGCIQAGGARNESRSPEPRAKPQRAKGKGRANGARRPSVGDVNKQEENTLRDWLVSAAKEGAGIEGTPKSAVRAIEVECSPSWADEPCPDDDFWDSSDLMTLTPSPQPPQPPPDNPILADAVRAVDGGLCDIGDGGEYEVVNIYDLPPSGRVTDGQRKGGRTQRGEQEVMMGTYGEEGRPRTNSLRRSGGDNGDGGRSGGAGRIGGDSTGNGGQRKNGVQAARNGRGNGNGGRDAGRAAAGYGGYGTGNGGRTKYGGAAVTGISRKGEEETNGGTTRMGDGRSGNGGDGANGGAVRKGGSGNGNGGGRTNGGTTRTEVSRTGNGGGGARGGFAGRSGGRNGNGGGVTNGGPGSSRERGYGNGGSRTETNRGEGTGGMGANGGRKANGNYMLGADGGDRYGGAVQGGSGRRNGGRNAEGDAEGGEVSRTGNGGGSRSDGVSKEGNRIGNGDRRRYGIGGETGGSGRNNGNKAEAGRKEGGEGRLDGGSGEHYGGARPKTKGKASNGQNRGNNNKSYASAAASTEWKTKQSKKRKYDNVSPKHAFPLKGIAVTRNRDAYIQGLELEDRDYEDVVDSVRAYLRERGINPVFIRIIPVKFDSTRVGCRLTVREADFFDVMQFDFWPDNINVREWTPRPRDNNGDEGQGEEPSSDSEN